MSGAPSARILAINTGSSSLKAALYRTDSVDTPLLGVLVERIGSAGASVRVSSSGAGALAERKEDIRDFDAALDALLRAASEFDPGHRLSAIGHRLVHGGLAFAQPQAITPEVMRELDRLAPQAPEHMPQALAAVRFFARRHRGVPQVACFDTSFHHTMPRVAQLIPLPEALRDEGFVRYGFHGLSYESAVAELRRVDPVAARGRTVVAHLGNGASMTAMHDGKSVDTTMGYTPTSGLVMSTRCGDIDPGVVIDLIERHKLTAAEVNAILDKQSGLLGVSGTSSDMRDLLTSEFRDRRAANAIELFCYRARKYLGAFASVLGGLDTLVFTGGIGENAAAIRERICKGQEYLGIALDAEANRANAPVVSAGGGGVTVRVIRADEEGVIARHTQALLGTRKSARHPALLASMYDP